jgi:hypothetical protein
MLASEIAIDIARVATIFAVCAVSMASWAAPSCCVPLGVEATQELEEVVTAEPAPELAAQLLDRGAPVGDVAAPRLAVLCRGATR